MNRLGTCFKVTHVPRHPYKPHQLALSFPFYFFLTILLLYHSRSGLDSRGALVVIRALRRISDTGRTVCCTIHQPSSAVFEMFDDLILLKKGGNVVFFGELGSESSKLVNYFESRGASPIQFGENP